ncbi:MAG: response regulator transcription factor, partial [Victivallaceae bacterium]|nr:response regulator transcription factor [Victivallaceae bacterium]
GYEVCRQIRRGNPALPIIFLSARTEEVDKVLGLELGADDYVTKPFSLRELLARVAARLRPRAASAAAVPESFDFAGWRIDPEKSTASRENTEVALSARELALLKMFAAHPGELLSRERIMKEVWGSSFNCSRTLDQHVVTLRKKLSPDIVQTVYGRGYRPGRQPATSR